LLEHIRTHILRHMRSAHWRWPWLAVMAATACGGDLLGAPSDAGNDVPIAPTVDASSPPSHDAAASETSPPDANAVHDGSAPDAVGPVCGAESWSTVFESFVEVDAGYPFHELWWFSRRTDFLDFVRQIAVEYNFTDPSTGMPCTTVSTCTYDPTQPRSSPQDVTHSNAVHEFIGPDGKSYVWAYYPPLNDWFLVEADRNPQDYQLVVDFNAGCSPNCACDAG
jgi:hypothetical protein